MTAVVNNPTLADVLDFHKKDILFSTNCHAVGTIKEFDAVKQLATVTINYKQVFSVLNESKKRYEDKSESYPILAQCPVVIMTGGSAALTLPIAPGDTCLVLFNDADLDLWMTTGATTNPPRSSRRHAFTDAIILVGLRSVNKALANYDTTRARLQNGTTYVGVSANKIKLANQITTLLTLLDGLVDLLSTGFSGPTQTAGNPINAATAAALTAYKIQLAGLLE